MAGVLYYMEFLNKKLFITLAITAGGLKSLGYFRKVISCIHG